MIISHEIIIKEILDYFGMDNWVLKSKNRKGKYVKVRQVIAYFCKRYTNMSHADIGMLLADQDHATITHSIKQVNNQIDTDKDYAAKIKEIKDKLESKKDDIIPEKEEVYMENDIYI